MFLDGSRVCVCVSVTAGRVRIIAGIQVPVDRIFGLGTGPKPGVLAQLLTKHRCFFFVFSAFTKKQNLETESSHRYPHLYDTVQGNARLNSVL